MTAGTPTTPAVLHQYRRRHIIKPIKDWDEDIQRFIDVCDHDGIRIYAIDGGWVHDRSRIKFLAGIERGESIPW